MWDIYSIAKTIQYTKSYSLLVPSTDSQGEESSPSPSDTLNRLLEGPIIYDSITVEDPPSEDDGQEISDVSFSETSDDDAKKKRGKQMIKW
jgi:hypothetical protein